MPDGQVPARGEVAPDFELLDSTAQPRRLADLAAGRTLVLLFYRGYW